MDCIEKEKGGKTRGKETMAKRIKALITQHPLPSVSSFVVYVSCCFCPHACYELCREVLVSTSVASPSQKGVSAGLLAFVWSVISLLFFYY